MTSDENEPYYGAPTHSTDDWTSGPLIPQAYQPQPGYPPPPGYLIPPQIDQPAPRKRGRIVLAAVATAVVLVGGGGAAYAYTALSGGGTQPERVLPRDTVAFAKVDLDPAAGQKIAAYRLSKHFSSVTKGASNIGGVEDFLLSQLFEGSDLDFARDIKPWLGDRAAVAAVTDSASDSGVDPVLAVAYTDKAKMTAALTKVTAADFGFVSDRGYALISDSQAHADALLPRIAQTTLADNPTFTGDVKSLHGDQIATAWADLGALSRSFATGHNASLYAMQLFGQAKNANGRVVLGVHANASYLELTGHFISSVAATGSTIDDTIAKLPADTSVAVQVSGLGDRLVKSYGMLQSVNPFANLLDNTDIQLPSDLGTVFGTQTTVSVHEGDPDSPVVFAIQAETNDAFRAEHVLGSLTDAFGAPPLTTQTTAHGYVVASDGAYASTIAKHDGTLGSTPAFTRAVPNAKGANAVAYVDVAAMLNHDGSAQDKAQFGDVSALGLSVNGNDFTVRLTTK